MDIPKKCKKCIHRLKSYCRGYGAEIQILDVDKCKRKKTEKRREKLKKKFQVKKNELES